MSDIAGNITKLISKLTLVERVLIEMIADQAKNSGDPDNFVKAFSSRIYQKTARKIASLPQEPEAQLVAALGSNEFETFFHRVLAEVRSPAG